MEGGKGQNSFGILLDSSLSPHPKFRGLLFEGAPLFGRGGGGGGGGGGGKSERKEEHLTKTVQGCHHIGKEEGGEKVVRDRLFLFINKKNFLLHMLAYN